MNKKIILSALTATILAASTAVNATLESRLSGKAYYDTDTGLTWTTDASPGGYRSWQEQVDFAQSLVIDGVSGWEMSASEELTGLIGSIRTCHMVTLYCALLPEPFHNIKEYFTKDTYSHVIDTAHSIEREYGLIYRPEMLEWIFWDRSWHIGDVPPPEILSSSWPVHHGDVPLVAVPEPSTYAMLLAGLGLVGFAARKNNS